MAGIEGLERFIPHALLPRAGAKKESKETKKKSGASPFSRLLGTEEEKETGEASGTGGVAGGDIPAARLDQLLDAVSSSGEALLDNPSPDNIGAYKAAVHAFVRMVSSSSYDMESVTSFPQNPFKKKAAEKHYSLLKVIDEKLEQLALDILRGQAKQLDILARLEEIKGILVDLVS